MSPDALLIRIQYEITQIQNEYRVIDSVLVDKNASLDDVEIRAVASALHSIYNGIEKILMMCLKDLGVSYSTDSSWHSNILRLANINQLITDKTEIELRRLMGFRHFFRHSYGFMLDNELMQPLYANIGPLINRVEDEILRRS